jgi:hypothetical protein
MADEMVPLNPRWIHGAKSGGKPSMSLNRMGGEITIVAKRSLPERTRQARTMPQMG